MLEQCSFARGAPAHAKPITLGEQITQVAERALPVVAALLGARGCRADQAKMALLYQAQGDVAARAGGRAGGVRG